MADESSTRERTIIAARHVRDRLDELRFKPLRRPLYRPDAGRSENEIRWGLRVFACPSVTLFRDLLQGFLVAYDHSLHATCFILARAMLETVAMTNYVCELAEPHIKHKRWDRAWNEVLERASIGSYYVNEHVKGAPDSHVLPLNVGKAIESLTSIVPESMKPEYSYLSEISHPDSLALMAYVDMNERGAIFHSHPQFRSEELEKVLGLMIALAALPYNRIFQLAEMKTASKEFTRIIRSFVKETSASSGETTPS